MDGVIQSIITFILIIEFIIGNLSNGFIVLVNCLDWIKRRKISSVDQILTALAISRIALLLSLITSLLVTQLYSVEVIMGKMLKMTTFLWIVANHFCMWLAACLGLFYFLKVANFSNSLLVYLRWRVRKVILVIMLVSLILLILEIVLMNSHFNVWVDIYEDNWMNSSSLNSHVEFYRAILILNTIFISFPFAMSQFVFLLLIFSLLKHLKKMRDNVQGCRDASTMAHITTLQIMVTSVLLCTIFFLGFLLHLVKSELLKNNLYIRFCQAASVTFPSVHSCVLILGNTKLRRISFSLWRWLRCWPEGGTLSGH